MRRSQIIGAVVMAGALVVAIWANSVHKNAYAGAVIVVTVVALGVFFGNLLGKSL